MLKRQKRAKAKTRPAPKSKVRRPKLLTLSLTPTVVAIDSDFDQATSIISSYRIANLYPQMTVDGIAFLTRDGSMAARSYLSVDCLRPDVLYVTASGHGLGDVFFGEYKDIIWQVGQYSSQEASGKIFHLLACRCALQLGPDLVKNGAKAFIGYDTDFIFTPDVANSFCDCDSEVDRALSEGLSVGEAFNRAQQKFHSAIAALQSNGPSYLASMLATNLAHLKTPLDDPMWGNANARVY